MTTQYNVNIVGNLTNDNGVLSGFSSNDYATLPETLEGLTINSLEVVFKFKTNSLTTNNAIFWTDKLIDTPSVAWSGLRLCNYNADGWAFDLEITNNNTQLADIYDTTAILPNKYYYIKMLYYNTSGYSLYKSEDGENYTLVGARAVTTMPINSQALIGRAVDTDPMPLDGSIDLNESYIKVNGATWWRGAESITKIQLRHDTAANWTSVNPILLEGEVGIETDTRKQKIGDGVTAWNSLPYDAGSTALQSITSSDVTTALGYTPVNKAGDTMTGGLRIETAVSDDSIVLKNTSDNTSSLPSTNQLRSFRATNNDGTILGDIRFTHNANGSVSASLLSRNYLTGSLVQASIEVKVSASGVVSCTFPNTTCCDGQWVNCFVQLTTTTAIGDYRIDLTNYLPNDGYKYEIMISGQVSNTNSTYGNVYLNNAHGNNGEHFAARVGTNCRTNNINCTLPVDSGRSIYMKITDHAIAWETHDNWTGLYLVGYRRIGSNS